MSAQTGDSSTVAAVSPEGDTEVEVKKLSLADAKALSEKVLNDSGIEDSAKEMLKPKFDQAIADLEEAATLQASAERFRASLETAPKEAETKRQETAKLPNAEEAGTVIGSYESSVELIRELAAAKANLESLQDELEKVTAQLETVREQRPSLISTRQPEAQSELEATRTELLNPDLSAEATAPGRVADRTVLLAQEVKLLAELEMLKQEKISTTAREELLEARQESLTRQVENSTALTKTLQNLEEAIMKQEAQEAESVVSSMKDTIAEDDLQGQELVAEVTALTEQLDRVAGYSSQIE